MASALKDTSMPVISSNVTVRLKKWVSLASSTVHERKKKRKFDTEQTTNRQYDSSLENAAKIIPVHGRSRSSPVIMPRLSKATERAPRRKLSAQPARRDVYKELEKIAAINGRYSDDGNASRGSFDGDISTLSRSNLRRNCSQSEKSLRDAFWSGEVEAIKIQARENKMRRTSSEDTQDSCESYDTSSDLDINGNEKLGKSSRAMTNINKRNKIQISADNRERVLAKKTTPVLETVRKINSLDETSRNIESRLDRWVDKASILARRKKESFDSTSSSDDINESPVFSCGNQNPASKEPREIYELQTALKELVTNCGTRSLKSSTGEKPAINVQNTNSKRTRRKISLQETREMWRSTVNSSTGCPEIWKYGQREVNLAAEGNVSEGSAGLLVEKIGIEREPKVFGKKHEGILNVSDDNAPLGRVDLQFSIIEDGIPNEDSRDGKDFRENGMHAIRENNSENFQQYQGQVNEKNEECAIWTIGGRSSSKNATEISAGNITTANMIGTNVGENECADDVNVGFDNNNGVHSEESGQRTCKQTALKCGAVKDNKGSDDVTLRKIEHKTEDNSLRNSMLQYLTFDDADLSAFAVECIRHANKKKQNSRLHDDGKYEGEEEGDMGVGKAIDGAKDVVDGAVNSRSNSLEKGAEMGSKWSSQSSILSSSTADEKTPRDKLRHSYEELENRNTLDEETMGEIIEKLSSDESLNEMTAFEEGAIVIELSDGRTSPDDREVDGNRALKDGKVEKEGLPGLRKFPSLPLFYIPKEDSNKSLKRSLWDRFKRRSSTLARSTENLSMNKESRSRRSLSPPPRMLDPFYHGGERKEDDLQPVSRSKAWTLSSGSRPAKPQAVVRPSLDTRRNVPIWKAMKRNSKGNTNEHTGTLTSSKLEGSVAELI